MNKTTVKYFPHQLESINGKTSPFLLNTFTVRISATLKVIVSDIAAIIISLICAGAINYFLSPKKIINNDVSAIFNIQLLDRYIILLPVLIFIFAYGGLYSRNFWEGREFQRIVQGISLLALCDGALIISGQATNVSIWMLTIWPIAALLVSVFRMVLRTVPFGFPAEVQNVILAGNGISSEKFLQELRESRCGPVRILKEVPLKFLADLGMDEIEHRIEIISNRFKISPARTRIVVAPSCDELDQAHQLLATLNSRHYPFSMLLPVHGLAQRGLSLHQAIGADFVLADVDDGPDGRIGQVLKRSMDLLLATLALVVLTPLLVLIAVLLRLEGGPAFFKQLRVGRNGRRFQCYKFRSMHPDAEAQLSSILATDPVAREEWKHHQKLANDPRITRLGEFLRTTSLDELPQLFNVMTGDMSMVGPRPIIAPEISGYENDWMYFNSADFTHYTNCKPGITGLWQVSGRARTTHRERVRLDRWYCRNWSVWLDLMIVLKTVRAVLIRTGN